jgi:hypothetical protein
MPLEMYDLSRVVIDALEWSLTEDTRWETRSLADILPVR